MSFPETQTRGESTRRAHQTSSWGSLLLEPPFPRLYTGGASARGFQEIQMNNGWRVSLSWCLIGKAPYLLYALEVYSLGLHYEEMI